MPGNAAFLFLSLRLRRALGSDGWSFGERRLIPPLQELKKINVPARLNNSTHKELPRVALAYPQNQCQDLVPLAH